MPARVSGRASTAMTRLVLQEYGTLCWLRLKGCTTTATTKDHVIPHSHGGEDTLENFRPSCKSCNSKRQNKAVHGYGASVVVIMGPPASGKSTYVKQHARPEDVVIDMDEIARALMPTPPDQSHTYPPHVRNVAIKARAAAVHSALRLSERVTVWLIHGIPKPDTLSDYRKLGYQIVTIDPGRDIVEPRARRLRPQVMLQHVARWYATYGAAKAEPTPTSKSSSIDDASPDW